MSIKQYIKNVFIWIDQGINTIILFGYPDETLSSTLGPLELIESPIDG